MNKQSLILAEARNKLLVNLKDQALLICGPTATGKTQLGIYLAKKFNGEIVSADSRQVYREMDIGTGKDLPENAKFNPSASLRARTQNFEIGYYFFDKVPVWMLDVVEPTEQFSVAHYYKLANCVIEDIWQRGKLPIVVGGTGLYIKALVDGIATITIPPNKKLREQYKNKTAQELFAILEKLDSQRASSMNPSDRQNPRRLIRAIEVTKWKWEMVDVKLNDEVGSEKINALPIGLAAPLEELRKRIDDRVERRVEQGMVDEVERLLKQGVSHERLQEFGLEYRIIDQYLQGKFPKYKMVQRLKTEIHGFARRQLTWFKKDNRVNWFDVTKPNCQEKVEKKVREWYNKNAKFK